MKYVLLLSLFYKHYKKSSTLKLFLDDQLIDEIILDKNIDPIPNFQKKHSQTIDKVAIDYHKDFTWVINKVKGLDIYAIGHDGLYVPWDIPTNKSSRIRWVINRLKGWEEPGLPRSKDISLTNIDSIPSINIPSKLWLYSLELNNTNKHISLNFEIHDNNYTNSFMTNTAMVGIHKIGLIPENLFYDKQKILSRLCKTTRSITYKDKQLVKEYLDTPFINHYEYMWIGGSKKYTISIIKKHNIFMLLHDKIKSISYITVDPYWFWLKRQQSIINMSNEDSRNYNT